MVFVFQQRTAYDFSRLLAGSMGIFGALTEVSLKVAPIPLAEETRVLNLTEAEALRLFNTWRNQPLPVSASAWEAEGDTGVLRVRLSGSSPALRSARSEEHTSE